MAKNRTPKLSEIRGRETLATFVALALAILAPFAFGIGCGGPSFETALEMPKDPRRPDGVVLEPVPALPTPEERAEARGTIALREQISSQAIEEVIAAYFHAFEHEDADALKDILTEDATISGGRGGLLETARQKMRAFDYKRLAGLEVARIDRMERWNYDDADATLKPPEMRQGDWLVRVPIVTANMGAERLFGDTEVFVLRRVEGHLRIFLVAELNSSP